MGSIFEFNSKDNQLNAMVMSNPFPFNINDCSIMDLLIVHMKTPSIPSLLLTSINWLTPALVNVGSYGSDLWCRIGCTIFNIKEGHYLIMTLL